MIERWTKAGEAKSVGLLGNAADIVPELVRRGVRPDMVTDQTSAHDPLNGYLPKGWTLAEWREKRDQRSEGGREGRPRVDARARRGDGGVLERRACRRSTTATTSARWRKEEGFDNAFAFPGFVPAYIRPLFCRGIGPFRWAALSGDPEDIYKTDAKVNELTPGNTHLHNWLDMARERIPFQGLPARICWVGLGDRHRLGLAFNEMVAKGELKAPVVIGRDHLDSGSVASPNRETESMKDGSDAVSDWPLLNALLNTASGATWVSLHHGGGVGMGFSQHAGMVIVADGTPEAARRLERVLWNDPATGVMRHADAGYEHRASTAPRNISSTCPAFSADRAHHPRRRMHRRMPWKNGGGETTEIAVSPDGRGPRRFRLAGLDGACRKQRAVFAFPGIDRTLAILEGEGIFLNIDGRHPVDTDRRFATR